MKIMKTKGTIVVYIIIVLAVSVAPMICFISALSPIGGILADSVVLRGTDYPSASEVKFEASTFMKMKSFGNYEET